MKKVILITGASSGIGEATSKKLLNQGHIVYGGARRVERMKDIEALGAKVLKLDVTKSEDIKAAVDTVINEQGRIDVLYNNAGFGLYGAVEDVSMEDARYQFDVNIFGLAEMTKAVLPHMRAQGSGTIINTSSVGGKVHTPLGSWYHASKHALEGWSDCLRLEVKSFGINVVLIEPGMINTEFSDVVVGDAVKHSKNSEYKEIIDAMLNAMSTDENGKSKIPSSEPSVIADAVLKAINSKKPKTRYMKGAMAKPLLFLRRFLGDKGYDRLLEKVMLGKK